MTLLHSELPAKVLEYEIGDGGMGLYCSWRCLEANHPEFYKNVDGIHVTPVDRWRAMYGNDYTCHECRRDLLPDKKNWSKAHCPQCGDPMYLVKEDRLKTRKRKLYYCGNDVCERSSVLEIKSLTGTIVHTAFMAYDTMNGTDVVFAVPISAVAEVLKKSVGDVLPSQSRGMTHQLWVTVFERIKSIYPTAKGDELNPLRVVFLTESGQEISTQLLWLESDRRSFGIA